MKQLNEKIKNEFLVEFGLNVRKIREQKNLTQTELANRINGDAKKISRIELGRYNFKISTLLIIAEALDVDVSELFNISNIDYLKQNIYK